VNPWIYNTTKLAPMLGPDGQNQFIRLHQAV
jgi:hypothetical protein